MMLAALVEGPQYSAVLCTAYTLVSACAAGVRETLMLNVPMMTNPMTARTRARRVQGR
jgi:hypothetical protein